MSGGRSEPKGIHAYCARKLRREGTILACNADLVCFTRVSAMDANPNTTDDEYIKQIIHANMDSFMLGNVI